MRGKSKEEMKKREEGQGRDIKREVEKDRVIEIRNRATEREKEESKSKKCKETSQRKIIEREREER